MNPSKDDTKVFSNGMRMTRSNKYKIEDEEDKLFKGYFGTYSLLGGSSMWALFGSISLFKGWTVAAYIFFGLCAVMFSIWVARFVVAPLWRWFIGLVAMVLIMAGCQHELKEGVIIAKHYEPERDYIYMMPVAHMRMIGKVSSPYYTYVPVPMHDDADYWIDIHGLTEKGKEKTESFYITEAKFESIEIGKEFCVDATCSKEPNEDSKK